MKKLKVKELAFYLSIISLICACGMQEEVDESKARNYPANHLNYIGTPSHPMDRSSLAFSDQGAWIAYGLPKECSTLGFSGPFLMTQGQGEWVSECLSQLELVNTANGALVDFENSILSQSSYNSHLEQVIENEILRCEQTLFYSSPHSAIISSEISNLSTKELKLLPSWKGKLFQTGMEIKLEEKSIALTNSGTTAKGIIKSHSDFLKLEKTDSSYAISLKEIKIPAQESIVLTLSHTFLFPEYDEVKELEQLGITAQSPMLELQKRIDEKENQLEVLYTKMDTAWQDSVYKDLLAKTLLTLQNNTRIAAGELKHDGIFPSYHYKWFLGFWAWDSWKHAAAVAHYDTELAKNQIRAMYDFQLENGFIVDCVFRDTTIENHNYRNTKPPLSAWAVWEVFEQDEDTAFIKEMYLKIVKQHEWWYKFRDYDKDSICEYGSTDGTLVAAKWESGMDNAVRFDDSEMVKSAETVYSLNQESVDLNAYLYAEKNYLAKMAKVLKQDGDYISLREEAEELKSKIQEQFFDAESGWYYDTHIDGDSIIKVMGCEGWIPLWAELATAEQAEAIKNKMMNPVLFNTKVPFQTLSASHPKFKPDRGYWRGPNWIDQAYFGVKGLHNYGFHEDAYKASYKLIHNAEGVLDQGLSIRENYNPMTGQGLESQNFSWSAAHYLLLLLNE